MSDIQVVRNQTLGFGGQGFTAAGEASHIKILTTFRTNGTLRQLSGAELKAFIDVALAEAQDPPGVTMLEIAADTDVSYRHLLRIMPRLCEHSFCAIEGTDRAGNQIYRVAAYAWFGKANRSVPSSRGSNTRRNQPTARGSNPPEQLPLVGGSNTDALPGTASNRPTQNARSSDKMSHDKMSHAIGALNNNSTESNSNILELDENLLLTNVATFRKLHVNEPVRTKLALTVAPELVARWAQWVPLAPFHPSGKFYKPVGWMITSLLNDPQCEPPDLALLLEKETARLAQAEYNRQIVSGEISLPERAPEQPGRDPVAAQHWQDVLSEMQLSMTKATFDTWVKPTFALEFDDAHARLCVAVRNAYAKQWLENRLYGIVERTVEHVVGKPVRVEFVLQAAVVTWSEDVTAADVDEMEIQGDVGAAARE